MPKKPKLSEQVRLKIEEAGEHGVSRYRLSQETGVSQATLSRFMKGERALSQAALDAIGEYLGLRIVSDRRPRTKKGE